MMGVRKSSSTPSSVNKPAASVYARRSDGVQKPAQKSQGELRILAPQKQENRSAAFYGRAAGAPAYSRRNQQPLQGNTGSRKNKNTSYAREESKAPQTGKAAAPAPKEAAGRPAGFAVAPGYIILWSFILGVCGYAYITHVFTTQRMLLELNDARQELERVEIIHQDYALEVERMSGPAEVLRRARAMGLENYGPPEFVMESAAQQRNQE